MRGVLVFICPVILRFSRVRIIVVICIIRYCRKCGSYGIVSGLKLKGILFSFGIVFVTASTRFVSFTIVVCM